MALKRTRTNFKYLFIFLLFTGFSYKVTAQIFLVNPEQEKLGIEYYKLGTIEMQNGNYIKADSLLTLSINIRPYKDNLFNRSVARLSLKDTCGFCSDALFASRFDDKEAEKLYNDLCQISDTTFYDRKMNIVDKQKFRYYKVQSIKKCSGDTIYELHDKMSKRSVYKVSLGPVTGFDKDWIDIIGIYKLVNNKKVYTFLKKAPNLTYELDPIPTYIRKKMNFTRDITKDINIKFVVTPEGKITDYELTPKEIPSNIKQKITALIYRMNDIKPARILGKNVNYEFNFMLDIAISTPDFIQSME